MAEARDPLRYFRIEARELVDQISAAVLDLDQQPGPDLVADILASLEGQLSRMKWPRSIDFIGEMPRDPSGKLLKRRLREPYWEGAERSV